MINKMPEVFDLLKNKDVYVFCTDPQIYELFLRPYGLSLYDSIKITKRDDGTYGPDGISIVLPPEKREQINNIFLNEWGFKDRITIGVNMFSAYYDTDIAISADKNEWAMKELLTHANSKYIVSVKARIDNMSTVPESLKERINCYFQWCGEKGVNHKKGIYDLKYEGYLYWTRTILFGLIHLCGLAKTKRCIITGAAWDKSKTYHFYETINKDRIYDFISPGNIDIAKSFITNFPDTKYLKTNPDSFLPFEYVDLKEAINA